MTTSKKRENPTTFLRRQVSTNSKGKVLFLDNTVTLSIVPPKEELSNRHSTMETSGKAGIPKWVPMKRIPWQFYQCVNLIYIFYIHLIFLLLLINCYLKGY